MEPMEPQDWDRLQVRGGERGMEPMELQDWDRLQVGDGAKSLLVCSA